MASTINATSSGSGGLISTGDASGQLELQANGSTKLTVSSSGVNMNGLTFPTTDGTSGQVIQTNGSGTLSFATPAGGSLTYISSVTASSSASISFTNIGSTYDVYMLSLVKVLPASGASALWIRTSTNNGSSYDAGGSDYDYSGVGNGTNSSTIVANSSSGVGGTDSKIDLNSNIASAGTTATYGGFNGFVYLMKPSSATSYTILFYTIYFPGTGGIGRSVSGMGRRLATADVDAIRFLADSGNIDSGTIHLYGIKNS